MFRILLDRLASLKVSWWVNKWHELMPAQKQVTRHIVE